MSTRLVVTGSRSLTDRALVWAALDAVLDLSAVITWDGEPAGLIHGGAEGVDRLAALWAGARGWPTHAIPYARGKAPGVEPRLWGKRRNQLMLDLARARGGVVVLAVWDGWSGGTADCIARARALDLAVFVASPANDYTGRPTTKPDTA